MEGGGGGLIVLTCTPPTHTGSKEYCLLVLSCLLQSVPQQVLTGELPSVGHTPLCTNRCYVISSSTTSTPTHNTHHHIPSHTPSLTPSHTPSLTLSHTISHTTSHHYITPLHHRFFPFCLPHWKARTLPCQQCRPSPPSPGTSLPSLPTMSPPYSLPS